MPRVMARYTVEKMENGYQFRKTAMTMETVPGGITVMVTGPIPVAVTVMGTGPTPEAVTDMDRATLDNTVFITICDYSNADEVSAPIKRTAEYFGIPLTFISYGATFGGMIDKLSKTLVSLKQLPGTIQHVFFVDGRDVVFVDTVQSIIDEYNLCYDGGVLFAGANRHNLYPYRDIELEKRIEAVHGKQGFVNSGTYAGQVTAVIALLERLLELSEMFRKNDDDPIVRLFCCNPAFIANKERYLSSDQFLIQALSIDCHSAIRIDEHKRLFGFFGGRTFPPLHPRKYYPNGTEDFNYIGSAKILHSHNLSQDRGAWNDWITSMILQP